MSEQEQPIPRLINWAELLDEFTDDAATRNEARKTGKPMGALTGFSKLDEAIGGALAPGLHVLHGSPGSGKTAFGLQIAATCQCPALFVTCEMSPIELLRRITSRISRQYLGRFKSGEMTPDSARQYASQAVKQIPMLGILDATRAAAQRGHIQQAAANIRLFDRENPHLLIIVDSVHSWVRGLQADTDEYTALNSGLDALRSMAQELNCAVIGIGERNRAAMKTGGQNATAGTRAFEYASESVIELQAEEKTDAEGKRPIKLTLSKNRHGSPGKMIDLHFFGSLQEFTEV